jgi:hypothetical protein
VASKGILSPGDATPGMSLLFGITLLVILIGGTAHNGWLLLAGFAGMYTTIFIDLWARRGPPVVKLAITVAVSVLIWRVMHGGPHALDADLWAPATRLLAHFIPGY